MMSIIQKILRKFFSVLGYEFHKKEIIDYVYLNFNHFLDIYFSKTSLDNFFFVQIGANDGKSNDPLNYFIKKFNLKGILIEPQKKIFRKLRKNYPKNENLIFANIAVSNENKKRNLYTLKEKYHETYRNLSNQNPTGIASFDKDHIISRIKFHHLPRKGFSLIKPKDINEYIEVESVECLSFEKIVDRYNIKKVDLLLIDTEGFDYEIIKMFDFKKFSPEIINYENQHLSQKDMMMCRKLLYDQGFKIFRHNGDSCAYNLQN